MTITITEALAEIKTLNKRIEKKRQFVLTFLSRPDAIRDPLEKDGGSAHFIKCERQSIADLESRIVALRRGIKAANAAEVVTIGGTSRSISDWLVWRRDVAPEHQDFLRDMRTKIDTVREQAKRQGAAVVQSGATPERPTDIVVNIDERALAEESESLETTLGTLDGALSLKNATVFIETDAT